MYDTYAKLLILDDFDTIILVHKKLTCGIMKQKYIILYSKAGIPKDITHKLLIHKISTKLHAYG